MTPIEKCLFIIQHTGDGDSLSGYDLRLTELAINGQLSPRGEAALDALYQTVKAGEYHNSVGGSCYGIPYLAIRPSGYVYWKDVCIEHYSYRDKNDERKAALALADRCLSLELRGLPVTSRSVSPYSPFAEAPEGTPWVEAMSSYYTMFGKDGKPMELILYRESGDVVALRMVGGQPVIRFSAPGQGAYEMYHILASEGLESFGDKMDSYAGFVSLMTAAGITPDAIRRARAAEYPVV